MNLAEQYDQFITAYMQQLEGLVFLLAYELEHPSPDGLDCNFRQLLALLNSLLESGKVMREDFGQRLREELKGIDNG